MYKTLTLLAALLLVTAACSKQEDRSAAETASASTANASATAATTANDAAGSTAGEGAVADATVPSAQTLALGKKIYSANCFACHGTGAAGAPKLGDKAAWAPRLARDIKTLHQHAIDGFNGDTGFMPPRGGFANLSDEEVKAAVDYVVHEDQ